MNVTEGCFEKVTCLTRRPLNSKLIEPIPKPQILDSSKFKEYADDNFKFHKKWMKVVQMGRKHCGKRSNFSFSHSVFKRLVPQTCNNQGLFGKRLKVKLPLNVS